MFSLIITVISVALVAALALATLYYGGAAFQKGAAEADASRLLNQGQQLLGAADMYFADHGYWPANLDALTAGGTYLKSVPVARAGVGPAQAGALPWRMPIEGQPVFLADNDIDEEACAVVNMKGSLKKKAILANAYTSLNAQCFGGAGAFKVVFKKFATPVSLDDGADGVDDFASARRTSAIPADNDASAWTRPPQAATGGGSGGTPPAPPPPPPPAPPIPVVLAPSSLAFPDTRTDAPSSLVMGVTNGSGEALFLSFQSSNPAFSSAGNSSCGESLAAGASCTYSVTFAPSGSGAHNATLTVSATGAGGTVTSDVPVVGTGIAYVTQYKASMSAYGGNVSAWLPSPEAAVSDLISLLPTAQSWSDCVGSKTWTLVSVSSGYATIRAQNSGCTNSVGTSGGASTETYWPSINTRTGWY